MIKFNIPPYLESCDEYVKQAIASEKIAGDGAFTKKCQKILEDKFNCPKVLLTTSGTTALEMACMLADIQPGDEVIMSSFTFSSTATAVVLFGGVPVFVDIRPDTMNINENLIEDAITPKTKAIMLTHYAGVGCEMDKICEIAKKHNLILLEDAAQVVNCTYKGKYLGTFGHVGCYSFHETKNYSMGEGGGVCINDSSLTDRASIVREKGTNRTQYINGQVDRYTWVDKGSSYLPSDILAAYMYPQLLIMDEMRENRVNSYNQYYEELKEVKEIGLPYVPDYCVHNGHMFFIKCKDLEERKKLQVFLREKGIETAFHYIPLHSSPAGLKFGRFHGEDVYTTKESERLLRLPMYHGLKPEQIHEVCEAVKEFYK